MGGPASGIYAPLPNLWDDAHADHLDEPGRLLYRSNLLGSDLRITNFGGGNTSAKVDGVDPLTGETVKVLWVKGSGGDLGSMKLDGFSTLHLDKLLGLKSVYRGLAHEDEMVALFNHCTFNLNPRATSIDTPLHGFVPHRHVDHVHADAVIAIAASDNAEELTRKIFEGELGFLPWQRPGFDLGLKLGAMAEANPQLKGVVLGGHGLFTWGPTSKACYETTLAIINKAAAWLAANGKGEAFGGEAAPALSPANRRDVAARLMPAIRKRISSAERKIGHFTEAPEVLEFVNSRDLRPLAALGTSCPDHFMRTKIRPLVLPFNPMKRNLEEVMDSLDELLAAYRNDYAAYYERCKGPNSPAMRDPNAVVYLVPGVGMLSFAKDKATARIASEFYVNAINVMRGASSVSRYVGLAEREAFDIEYWLLEEAKLQR
ncbi:MAG TPA: bifunctional rhamnulose-1-phosphate aldolase/short-chain dehydrogenase, partial [Roseiarcus sp.]|nr:bifunctional rhamnulose-1-phosphate aldolase/short-chain dehydrogenase [Roseiarcus sp.]